MVNDKDTACESRRQTRRSFLKKTALLGAGAAAAGLGIPSLIPGAAAAERGYILVGRCNPASGAMAGFGQASPWADRKALELINRDGGIYIKKLDKKLPVRMKLVDTRSDVSKATDLAAKLILDDRIDVMIALHTPPMVNAITAVCERLQTPCIALGAPLESWLMAGRYKWSYQAFWSVSQDFYPLCKGLWSRIPTNRVIGLAVNSDIDGMGFGGAIKDLMPGHGYEVVAPGAFPYGTQDFSALIKIWKQKQVEILFGNLEPADWAVCWDQCRQTGFLPKVATVSRAILFPRAVEALAGNLADGLTSEVWWSPHHPFSSSLSSQSAEELCRAWTDETQKQWIQPLGFNHAAYEILADALNRCQSLDKGEIREAIAATDLETIVGPIKFNRDHYTRTPLVGGQWVRGGRFPWRLDLVYNRQQPGIPLTGEMRPFPGSVPAGVRTRDDEQPPNHEMHNNVR